MYSNCGITAECHSLERRSGSRVHGVGGPVHRSGAQLQAVPEPPRLPRPGDHALRMALAIWRRLLGKGEFHFQGLPLKIDKGSGSPVRAIATLTEIRLRNQAAAGTRVPGGAAGALAGLTSRGIGLRQWRQQRAVPVSAPASPPGIPSGAGDGGGAHVMLAQTRRPRSPRRRGPAGGGLVVRRLPQQRAQQRLQEQLRADQAATGLPGRPSSAWRPAGRTSAACRAASRSSRSRASCPPVSASCDRSWSPDRSAAKGHDDIAPSPDALRPCAEMALSRSRAMPRSQHRAPAASGERGTPRHWRR